MSEHQQKINFQSLLSAILLIIAGILSPSNGVDNRSFKTPQELITTMLLIAVTGFAVYLIWTITARSKKRESKKYYSQNNEKS